MPSTRRICAGVGLAVAVLALVTPPAARAQLQPVTEARARSGTPAESSQVLLDWERIVFRTVYTDGLSPVPGGVPLMGFTSMAMYDAVEASLRAHSSSETAAVAAAAHAVLVHYFPSAAPKLDADLAATLAGVPDGPAEARGRAIGAAAGARMVASRVGDGYGDPTIHYIKAPGPGVWQPVPPATDMLVPWLGSLRPLVVSTPVRVGGPDPLSSRRYAAQYEEVRRLGSATSTERTPEQTATALFFNSNSATMVSDALVRHLSDHPIDLRGTARLFAEVHAAMTDSVISCWRLKRDVGFWRPDRAIALADTDGNPATSPQPGWAPLVPTPPYSDYVSGHACLTAPAVEVIRRTLGERTPLELVSVNSPTPRVYELLGSIERDAFWARIWSGLHYRTAMEDGYRIGHVMARRVLRAFD